MSGDATDFCAKAHNQYPNQCKEFVPTNYDYEIALAPNLVFILLFAISMMAYALSWLVCRRAGVFTISLLLGCFCEILGYAGRILSWHNPWEQLGFLLQICCLTIAPAFMAAGIYLCLRKIVYAFGQENSRISAKWYTRIVSSYSRPSSVYVTTTSLTYSLSSLFLVIFSLWSCKLPAVLSPQRLQAPTLLPRTGPTS